MVGGRADWGLGTGFSLSFGGPAWADPAELPAGSWLGSGGGVGMTTVSPSSAMKPTGLLLFTTGLGPYAGELRLCVGGC